MDVRGIWVPDDADMAPKPPLPLCKCGVSCWRVGGEAACAFVIDPNLPDVEECDSPSYSVNSPFGI
jgi:hypothetical protein